MSRRGALVVVCALSCALMTVLPAVPGPSATAAAVARPHPVTVPAYSGSQRLKARLPVGGVVTYNLPRLAVDGVRLMGDWDGDGAVTPGVFTDGVWQLWNHLVRVGAAWAPSGLWRWQERLQARPLAVGQVAGVSCS